MGKQPPRLFTRLLRWFCHSDFLEELEGDLLETYHQNSQTHSRLIASLIYVKEVLFLIRPSVIGRLQYRQTFLWRNYFFIALRNYKKNSTYAIINILGMSIGLACCIVSYLNYTHNNSYDTFHQNYEKIYRVNYTIDESGRHRQYGLAPQAISDFIAEIPAVGKQSDYIEWSGNVIRDDEFFDIYTAFVSPNFLDIFTFPLTDGRKESLRSSSAIFISESMADRLFSGDAMGQTIEVIYRGETMLLEIAGIFRDIPSNSSIRVDAFTNLDNILQSDVNEWDQSATVFIELDKDENRSSIESVINTYSKRNEPAARENNKEYYLDPLAGMAKHAMENNIIGPLEVAFPVALDIVPIVISGFILILACFTFTNTTIASASSRLKEIGVRKVMGGRTTQIIGQFLFESLMICLMAGLCAIPLAQWLAIQYSELLPFLEIRLEVENNISFFLFLGCLLLATGMIAGIYPSFFLSRFQPASILKGRLRYRTVHGWTKVLLSLQFAFAVLTISSAVFFVRNAGYVQNKDLGFDTENTVVVRFGENREAYEPLKNALSASPRVESIAGSVDHVGRRYHNASVVADGVTMDIVGLDVGPQYLQTSGLTLSEGRDLNPELASDYVENVLINETFARHMGWDTPVGKRIIHQDTINYYVAGVVKDFYFDAFNSPITPLWIRLRPMEEFNYLIARASPSHAGSLIDEVRMTWRKTFGTEPEDIKPPEYAREEATIINGIIMKVLVFLGSVSGILAIIGFYSLVSLNLYSKTKEIGIRRVLGSSVFSVINSTSRDYWLILLTGVILGTMLSYLFVPMFMEVIWASHISSDVFTSLLSTLVILATCLATVASRVLIAVRTNPVELLRDE